MEAETVIIKDCKFLVDKNATANYFTEFNAPCDCTYCRNYFKAVQSVPSVINFLNIFSVNVNRPDECIELDVDFKTKTLLYSVWYSVIGETEQSTKIQLLSDATAEILLPNNEFSPNTEHDDNYFWICLEMRLPWSLNEDINQLNPTKQKSLLKPIVDLFKK